jgi:hypothetical protein
MGDVVSNEHICEGCGSPFNCPLLRSILIFKANKAVSATLQQLLDHNEIDGFQRKGMQSLEISASCGGTAIISW